ncbi:MAG: hypothetical protein SH859_06715, partial [Hyphomicrobium aestuarii]|nr:hypothetical protein [Hyphomicrobium aestuarii]
LPVLYGERGGSRLTGYEPVQPSNPQQTAIPAPRAPKVDDRTKGGAFGERVSGPHKPTLDEMGPHASLSIPRAGKEPPRFKPETFTVGGESSPSPRTRGEGRGDGASRGLGAGEGRQDGPARDLLGAPLPGHGRKAGRTVEINDDGSRAERQMRRGRPKKTGRPGA